MAAELAELQAPSDQHLPGVSISDPIGETTVTESPGPAAVSPPDLSSNDLKHLAEQAALANGLPVDFFIHLIHRESAFHTNAISIAGAQGIAQFMPATAKDYGLKDPFNPTEALPKSAELLRDLKLEFGNLGLAAAAYNAGGRRVHEWLEGRGYLPAETAAYVYGITGRNVEDWAPPGAPVLKPVFAPMGAARASWTQQLDAKKNWELALLLSIGGKDKGKLGVLTSPVNSPASNRRDTAQNAKSAKIRRINAELSLCNSCIVQSFY